jgi:hypothetical protein
VLFVIVINCIYILSTACSVSLIMCVVSCPFFLIVVCYLVMPVICELCHIIVLLPSGKHPLAVKINNNNNNSIMEMPPGSSKRSYSCTLLLSKD